MSVGVRDVAALAGVSPGTVSNFFNRPERVSAETAERIRGAVRSLRYVPHEGARRLRAGGSAVLGFLTFELDNPFGAAVYEGADRAAAEQGYSLVMASSRSDRAREVDYLDFFERQRVAGLLVAPYGDVRDELAVLEGRGVAVAILDWSGADHAGVSVRVDDVLGGRLAAEHLLDQGIRHLVFVGSAEGLRIIDDRLAGVAAVAAERGAHLEVIALAERTSGAGLASARAWRAGPGAGERTGFVAVNDLVALGLLQSFAEAPALCVPAHVAVVGFDDLEILRHVVSLSSVHRPAHEIGRLAVDAVLRRIRHESAPDIVLAPHLVVRGSSR